VLSKLVCYGYLERTTDLQQLVSRCRIAGRIVFLTISAMLAVIATHSTHAADAKPAVVAAVVSGEGISD
jgi:hypothetical protein